MSKGIQRPWAWSLLVTAVISIAYGQGQMKPGDLKPGNVTEARVLGEASSGDNWMVNGGNFGSQHFSPLKQISDKNVAKLGLAWSLDIDSPMGMATEPLVIDGTIYVTASLDRVLAVDAASGKVLWSFDPHVRLSVMRNSWAARTNRGVAVWEGKVFLGTGDCRMIALDAASGRQLWESPVCVDTTQTGITGAPRVGAGKVFIGYNGSDTGVRGSVVAFDANTGKLAWRFWNVPGDPSQGFENKALEMAAKTWSGDQWWRVGGGDVWDPIAYDNTTGLLIYGTAGATPEGLFGDRADLKVDGQRLFAGCIVAVRADTGEYAWHYQTSIHSENFHVLITDLMIDGTKRHVVLTVPRNGDFFVLDATKGTLISKKALDGRPPQPPNSGPERTKSGHNWWPMSYNPVTGLVYIPAYDDVEKRTGYLNQAVGRLVAWDPVQQSARWSAMRRFPTNGGVLSTAGNLVFQGEGTGEFEALAADTGQKLWSVKTGSAIDSVPVTFMVHGEQYVVIPVGLGSASRLFGPVSAMATPESKRGPSRLLAFKIGATKPFPYPPDVVPPIPKPPLLTASAEEISRGEKVFDKFICGDCHSPRADGSGAWVVNGAIPDLRYMPPDVHDQFVAIVFGGSHRQNGMPGFGAGAGFPLETTKMTVEEANALHAYVTDLQWKAYKAEQQAKKPDVKIKAPDDRG
jgi:quinohemoprotein ethanol dehydrogenase